VDKWSGALEKEWIYIVFRIENRSKELGW
jgi:hypothetical protein